MDKKLVHVLLTELLEREMNNITSENICDILAGLDQWYLRVGGWQHLPLERKRDGEEPELKNAKEKEENRTRLTYNSAHLRLKTRTNCPKKVHKIEP